MDDRRFDALARSLGAERSRRGLTRLLGSLVLAGPPSLLGLAATDAKKKGKKKKGKKNKKKCTNDETRCDDECVDLQSDPKHCGDCDEECDVGQNCKLGDCVDTCAPFCTAPEACCDAECVNLQTDAKHCGDCGKECGATESCRNAQCVPCEDPMALCTVAGEQQCVDVRTDSNNCGSCGTVCAKDPEIAARDEVCIDRQCDCPPDGATCNNGRCCPASHKECIEDGAGCCTTGFPVFCPDNPPDSRCCPPGHSCGGTCGEDCCLV